MKAVPTFWPPAAKDDGVNGDALLTLPQGIDDGTLSRRSAEARIGVGTQCRASCLERENSDLFSLRRAVQSKTHLYPGFIEK